MTPNPLGMHPRHELFANPRRGLGFRPSGGMAGEKKQTAMSATRAGPVLANLNASVLGYRSKNRSRET